MPDELVSRDLAAELALALNMLFSVATDDRTKLVRGELYTDMSLNGAREALTRAKQFGLIDDIPRWTEPSEAARERRL